MAAVNAGAKTHMQRTNTSSFRSKVAVTFASLKHVFGKSCLLGCIFFAAYAPNLYAQAYFFWDSGGPYEYDSGYNPSVAVCDQIVEVHNGQNGAMWYRVGELNGSTITWSNGGNSIKYGNGWNPSVACYGSIVVEVHNGQNGAGPLWYRVGELNESTITWSNGGNSIKYDNGWNPSVALFGSTVLEVHNGQNGAGPLWYRAGQLNGATITWGNGGNSIKYDKGWNPSVALFGSDERVVEVHNGQTTAGPLWYHVGQLNGSTITWSNGGNYDHGWNPKVACSIYIYWWCLSTGRKSSRRISEFCG